MKQLERPAALDETAFAALRDEIAHYVAGPGEAWSQRIERERRVPPELWDELGAQAISRSPRRWNTAGAGFLSPATWS